MRTTVIAVSAIVTAALAVASSGCGKKASADDAPLPPGLVSWQKEVNQARTLMNSVLANLDEVVAAADNDPRPHYDAFVKNLDALETQAATAKKRGDDVRAQGKAYFLAWEEKLKDMGSPDVVEIATERRDDLNGKYEAIQRLCSDSQAPRDAFLSDLRDIKTILQNDLNPQGIKTIAPQIDKLDDSAEEIASQIDVLNESLGSIAAIYSPGAK